MADLTIPAPILQAHEKMTSASKVVSGEVVHPASVGLSHVKAEPSGALTLSAVARIASLISDFQDSLIALRRRYLVRPRRTAGATSSQAAVSDEADLSCSAESSAFGEATARDLPSALRATVTRYQGAFQELRQQAPQSEQLFAFVAEQLAVLDRTRGADELQALAALGLLTEENGTPAIDTSPLERVLADITQAAVAANEC